MTDLDRARRMEREPRRRGCGFKAHVDTEVRRFVEEWLPHMTYAELAQACLERFGANRAPSKSSIHRYATWKRALANPAVRPPRRGS